MKTAEQARAAAEKANLEYAEAARTVNDAEQALYKTPAYLHLMQCQKIRDEKLDALCEANKMLASLECRCINCGHVLDPNQRSIALQRATV